MGQNLITMLKLYFHHNICGLGFNYILIDQAHKILNMLVQLNDMILNVICKIRNLKNLVLVM